MRPRGAAARARRDAAPDRRPDPSRTSARWRPLVVSDSSPEASSRDMSSAPTTPPSVDKVDGFSRKSVRKARQKRSQSSSQFRSQGKPIELTPLPLLKDVPSSEQPELFLKKLQQCCVIFDFMDTLSDLKMKEYKRSTLNELVDYITISRGCLTEQTYPEVVRMVSFFFSPRTPLSYLHSDSQVYLLQSEVTSTNGSQPSES